MKRMPLFCVAAILSAGVSASAQDDALLRRSEGESAVLEKLASSAGREMALEPGSPVQRFLRDFALTPPEGRQVEITDELLEKAAALRRFLTRDPYFPGSMVFVREGGVIMTGVVKEADGDRIRVQWETREGVEKVETLTRSALKELNAPRIAPPGRPVTFVDVRIDPANDELLRPMLEKSRSIVDELMPEFTDAVSRNDLDRATRVQTKAIERIYNDAMIDGQYFSGSFHSSEYQSWLRQNGGTVSAGRAWVDRTGVCHTRAGVIFSAFQTELLPRMGMSLQLHRGKTSDGGIFHTWAALRLANGEWVYDAPSWAQGDLSRGFQPDQRHLYGQFKLYGSGWGSDRVIDGMAGETQKAPPPDPRGYTDRFVENLVRARAGDRPIAEVVDEVLAKWKYEAGREKLLSRAAGPGRRPDRGTGRGDGAGFVHFAGAYALKEAFVAVETNDFKRIPGSIRGMLTPEFFLGWGVFTGAAGITQAGIVQIPFRRVSRAFSILGLPLIAGTAATQAVSGNFSKKNLAVSSAAYLVAGTGVNLLFGSRMPLLRAALALYWGEKLEQEIHRRKSGKEGTAGSDAPTRDGAEDAVLRMSDSVKVRR